jgi:hypothetical protein
MKQYCLTILLVMLAAIHETAASTGVSARTKAESSRRLSTNVHGAAANTNEGRAPINEDIDASPVLEAFEKEIFLMVKDFGQDLRELVEKMKQSMDDGDDTVSSDHRYGGTRTKRRRSRHARSKTNNIDEAKQTTAMSSVESLQELSEDDSRSKIRIDSSTDETANASPTEALHDTARNENNNESPKFSSKDSAAEPFEPSPLQHDWNVIDLDAQDVSEADDELLANDSLFSVFSIEDHCNDDDEQVDPLRMTLLKKATSFPLTAAQMEEPMSIFMLQLPDQELPPLQPQEQQQQAAVSPPDTILQRAATPTRNPFAKLFQGRRVESVVSLWTVDKDEIAAAETKSDDKPLS